MNRRPVNEEQLESLWRKAQQAGMTRRRFLYLLGSAGAAAVLASCAPAAVTDAEKPVDAKKEMETIRLTKLDGTIMSKTVEKPQYGGWATTAVSSNSSFDPRVFVTNRASTLAYEWLVAENWARGPSGTGEFQNSASIFIAEDSVGQLAESWEQPDPTTFVFHLRKGIHFQNKPPANGREMVADDFVYTFRTSQEHPLFQFYKKPGTPEGQWDRATALDKYSLQVKIAKPDLLALKNIGLNYHLLPSEAKGYNLEDWKNSCGTGPFIVTDSIPGSRTTMAKNPDYWQFDPLHPNNRLPYIDGLNILTISDESAQMTALRTGQIDRLVRINALQARSLIKTNPELKYRAVTDDHPPLIHFNVEHQAYSQLKVRQALMLAVNFKDINRNYFDGEGTILYFPLHPQHGIWYMPLEEYPDNIQQLYSYNTQKAKQLLAEAGYPAGFKTHCITKKNDAESLSLLKEYFAAVGVDMEIRVVEDAAFDTTFWGGKWTDLAFRFWGTSSPYTAFNYIYRKGNAFNPGHVYDALVENTYPTLLTVNPAEHVKMLKQLSVHVLEQAYQIPFPAPPVYTLWQPWLKGYNGEAIMSPKTSIYGVFRYVWVDQALKKQMGR